MAGLNLLLHYQGLKSLTLQPRMFEHLGMYQLQSEPEPQISSEQP